MTKPIKIEPGCKMPEEGQEMLLHGAGRVGWYSGRCNPEGLREECIAKKLEAHWLPMPPAPSEWPDTVEVPRELLKIWAERLDGDGRTPAMVLGNCDAVKKGILAVLSDNKGDQE